MKTKLIFTLLLSFYFYLLSSQIPQGFNYQAVARNASGNPITNAALPVTITIQSDSLGGTIYWEELHSSIVTNGFGLFNLVVGQGSRQSVSEAANFSDIDWTKTPKFIKIQLFYKSELLNMGSSRLWTVPYSMAAGDLSGPVDKLEVAGKTDLGDEALFEVKNKDGQTVFAVFNDGVRIYVNDGDAKGKKGGFAVGGFDKAKGINQDYLTVNRDSVRIYLDTNSVKAKKGGFAVGGFGKAKGGDDEYLRVTTDSVKVSKSLLIPRLTTEERDNLPFVPGEALIIFNLTEGCMQIFKNNVWSNIWCFNCAPAVIIQPVDKTICSSENTVFFISATGTNLNYQWEESIDNGNTWNSISDGGSVPAYSGARYYSLSLSDIPVGHHNYKYRCIVTGSCPPNVASNIVTLNVGSAPPVISFQPIDQQLSVGCTASFSIVSPGFGVFYKWQQSTDGGNTWSNISDGGTTPVFSGSKASTLSLSNVPLAYNNSKYRCIASNSCGDDATSNTVTLSVNTPPEIILQPLNQIAYAGQNATFNITVSGSGNNYQWQESTNGGSTWANINNGGGSPAYTGTNTSVLFLSNVPVAYNNFKYRCVVGHYCRPESISDAAALSVATPVPVTDIDGNTYNTVGIGSQLWMAENLKTTRYADGTPIPLVNTNTDWDALTSTSKAYCWYNDNISNKDTYGAMYTWAAAMNGAASSTDKPSGVQGVCPTDWHLPSDAEWVQLETYLGGSSIAGDKMKETGTTHWSSPSGGTNESGFTALPGGFRNHGGEFNNMFCCGYWWNSVENSSTKAYSKLLINLEAIVYVNSLFKEFGISVRCVKD